MERLMLWAAQHAWVIVIGGTLVFLLVGRCITARWARRLISGMPFAETPFWMRFVAYADGKLVYRKPETVLETSSVRGGGCLSRFEKHRREKIIAVDSQIVELRKNREEIKARWVRLLCWDDLDEQMAEEHIRAELLKEYLAENGTRLSEKRAELVEVRASGDIDCVVAIRAALKELGEATETLQRGLAKTAQTLRELNAVAANRNPRDLEKRERAAAAFDALSGFPNVMAVDVRLGVPIRFSAGACEDIISVYTDTLFVRGLWGWWELGNFRLDLVRCGEIFSYSNGVHNLATTHADRRSTPYGRGGHHCFDTFSGTIRILLAHHDIPSAVVVMLKSITHVNYSTSAFGFRRIRSWNHL